VIYGLLEYNIPGDITGRNEPELNSIFNIPGIRGYRRYSTYFFAPLYIITQFENIGVEKIVNSYSSSTIDKNTSHSAGSPINAGLISVRVTAESLSLSLTVSVTVLT
jgi:hypothetical protein